MRCIKCKDVLDDEYTRTGQTMCDDCVCKLPVICTVCKDEIVEDEDFPARGDVCADCLDNLQRQELEDQLRDMMDDSYANQT